MTTSFEDMERMAARAAAYAAGLRRREQTETAAEENET